MKSSLSKGETSVRLVRLNLVVLLVASAGCYAEYVAPAAPMPEQEAVNLSYRFSESQGYRPVGVRGASYHPEHGVWRVNVALGPPSCGVMKVVLNAFNGRVLEYSPNLHPCEAPPPRQNPDL
jgi:hypothetical protein